MLPLVISQVDKNQVRHTVWSIDNKDISEQDYCKIVCDILSSMTDCPDCILLLRITDVISAKELIDYLTDQLSMSIMVALRTAILVTAGARIWNRLTDKSAPAE